MPIDPSVQELLDELSKRRAASDPEGQERLMQRQQDKVDAGVESLSDIYRRSLEDIDFLRKAPRKAMMNHLNTTYDDVVSFAELCAMNGVDIREGLRRSEEINKQKETVIKDYFREYRSAKGLTTLDPEIVFKKLLEDNEVPSEDKHTITSLREQIRGSAKSGMLLATIEGRQKVNDFASSILVRAKSFYKLEKELGKIEVELAKASEAGDSDKVRLLETEMERRVRTWAWMHEKEMELKAPEAMAEDYLRSIGADIGLHFVRGSEFYLPKKWTKSAIAKLEDIKEISNDVFGPDPEPEGLMAVRDTVVGVGIATLPAVVSWQLAGKMLGSYGFKTVLASGVVDKLLPAGHELLGEEGKGWLGAAGEIGTGLGYAAFGYGVAQGVGATVGSLSKSTKFVAQKLKPLILPKLIALSSDNPLNKAANRVAAKNFTNMIASAIVKGDTEQKAAKALLDSVVDEVEQCPVKWNALGRSVQEACDALEDVGVKGIRHPKPSPELIYVSGLRSGSDKEVVEETVKQFGKSVDELDWKLVEKMQNVDKVTTKLFDHPKFQKMLSDIQEDELRSSGKNVLKKATKKEAKVEATVITPEPNGSSTAEEMLLKKLSKIPASERATFLKAHGVSLDKLTAAAKQEKLSSKFVESLDEVERHAFNATLLRKEGGGMAPAVKTAINHRVNNAAVKFRLYVKKGQKEEAKNLLEDTLKKLYTLKKTDGSLVDSEVGKGARRLRRLYKRYVLSKVK